MLGLPARPPGEELVMGGTRSEFGVFAALTGGAVGARPWVSDPSHCSTQGAATGTIVAQDVFAVPFGLTA